MKKKRKLTKHIKVEQKNRNATHISLFICVILAIFLALVMFQTNTPTAQKIHTIKSSLLKMKLPPKADKNIKMTTVSQNNYRVKLASTSYVDQAVVFKSQDSSLSFTPLDNSVLGAVNKTKMTQNHNVATYENLYNGVNLIYTSTKDKLLEEYEVRSKKLVTEIIQKIDLQNIDYQKKSDGSIEFYKKGTKTFIYALPKPVMYEKFNTTERNYNLHYEIITQNSVSYLVKMIDNDGQKWLSKASYPVMIDGTVITTSFTTESFPVSLGKWKTRIDTVGTGNLHISTSPIAHTHFESLTCNDQSVGAVSDSNGISVQNFNCSGSAFVTYGLDQPDNYSMNISYGQDSQTLTTTYSQTATPVFETAYVDPTLVSPGDIMNVYAHITDESGIASVSADMGGVETISLSKVSGTANDGQWKATWKVHDTKTKEYITTIKATNVNNVSSTSHEITWFDPYSCLGGGDHAGADWTPATDCPGGIAGNHTNIGTMTIATGTTATVQAYDGTNYGTFQASATTVSIVGTLTADGKGYRGGTAGGAGEGPGAGQPSSGGGYAGAGGHGGAGGTQSAPNGTSGQPYGSFTSPTTIGSGGASAGGAAGAGGGAIKIIASGTVTISGTITANGAGGANFSNGGGAGGSLWIIGDSFTGAGIVRANGGTGGGNSTPGGGGGRVAMYYSSGNTYSGTPTATGAGPNTGENGTAILVDSTNNDLYIKSSQSWRANPSLEGTTHTYRDVFVTGNSTWLWKSYYTDNTDGIGITFNTRDFNLASGSTISADGYGYRGGTSSGDGSGPGGGGGNSSSYAGGAGHAVPGKPGSGLGGAAYGSAITPIALGSGGGASGGAPGSNGGGAVSIIASGTVTEAGTITVNGNGCNCGGGGGSGGSVLISASTIAGGGTIRSNGGGTVNNVGTGAGGRIALKYSASYTFNGTLQATNPNATTYYGSVDVIDTTNNDLYIKTSQTWDANPSLEGSIHYYRNVYIQNNSTWYWKGYYTTDSDGVGITFHVNDFNIASGSSVNSNGLGYYGGIGAGNGAGPGGGGSGGYGGGGGYGHAGRDGNGAGGPAYGSSTVPLDLGSGGGGNGGGTGLINAGGGAIRIAATGTITVTGSIVANGSGNGSNGGGSGGSIFLTGDTLTGAGSITANGAGTVNNVGTGAGGRIATYYQTSNSLNGTIQANGIYATENGTVVNSHINAPTLTSLGQFQTNCSTSIAVDGNLEGTPGNFTGCFKGTVADGDNPDSLSFEFESQPIGTSFTNVPTFQSTPGAYTGTALTQSVSATGFTIATAYHWQARAVDQYGAKSAWASFGANTESQNDFTANLPSPTNISVTYTSDTQLDVSWSNTATTNDSVVIERSTDDGSYSTLQTLAANALTYSDTSTSANHKYIYRVKNMLGALSSGYGTGSAAYTTPAAPSGISISQTKMGTIALTWTDNSAYEGNFEVQRKIGSGSFTTISSSVAANATAYTDSTVGELNDYTYQVRAIRTTPDPLTSAFDTSSALPISLGAGKGVYLTDTGRLFIENDVNKEVDVWTKVQDDTTNQSGTDLSYTSSLPAGGPNLPTGATINNLTVSQRTSLADGKSDVVYISTDKGMVMIHENALTPADGAIKRYTNDYISELMIGDIRATWPLDDSTGSGVFDVSNNGQTLTNNGGTTFGSGARGKSAIFNGGSQYLSIADNARLSVTGSVTFGAWFKSNSTSTDQIIMSKNGSYKLELTSAGKVKATITGATTATVTSATEMDTNWHHAIVTYSSLSQTLNLYVDGKTDNGSASGTIPASITDSSGDFEIGADNGSTFFNGSIDESFITSENITGNHVQFIYLTGYRALQNHTASAINGIGTDSYQKLLGNGISGATVNNVQVVAIDDNNQFMYIGTNDTTTNTGGISVVGTYSDSVVDLYDPTNNTNKKDDNGNQFSANDVLSISVAGVPNPAYRGENDVSSYGGTIAVIGTNDTATRLWLENQSYSLNQVLGASTGGGSGTDGLRVPPSLTNAIGTNGEFLYVPSFEVSERGTVVQNYQGVDTDITAMSFNDGVLTSGTTMALTSTTMTTGKVLDLTANALTSGTGFNLSSSSNAFTGSLADISLTGTTGVTGNVLNLSSTGSGVGNKVLNISATGTGATNTGLYISATGATNNYAAIFANGNVGIGTSTPTQGLEIYNKNALLNKGNLQFNHLTAPGALTATSGTTGSLTGTYLYKVTFVTGLGETEGGTVSSAVFPSTKRVELTDIPVDPENIATSRKIYRTMDSGTTYLLLTTINDNITTTYSDNTVDASLGTALSDFNTTSGGILVDGIKRLQFDQNGNIGLGTTTPLAKLDIAGSASASANLSFSGTSTKIQQLNGGALTFQTSVGGDAGLTTRMALSNSGALTIGTQAANANAKLDVNGNVNLSNGTSNTIFYGTAGIAGPGTNSAGQKIQFYGTAGTVSSTDYAMGIESNNLWFNSAGGFKWYTNSAIDGILNATGLSVGTVSQANKLDVSGGAAIGSYAGVNAAPSNGLIVSGNVGVGTTTPSTHFQVSDSGAVANGKALVILDQYENQDLLTASASGATKFKVSNTGVITGSSLYDLDNTSFFIDPSATGTSANLAGGINAAGGVNIGTTYSGLSSISNGLLVEGNVGIGTTAPAQKLDVAGNLKLFDQSTGTGNIFSSSLLDRTWTTTSDFNIAGVTFSAGMANPATNNQLQLNSGTHVGTGADGAISLSSVKNINTDLIAGGRSYADGIAYRIIAPADSSSTVTRFSGSDTVNNGIANGDEVLIINLQGTSADNTDVAHYEFKIVSSTTASSITFTSPITKSYDGTLASNQRVIIQRVPQYTDVTLTGSGSITASAWDSLTTTPTGTAGYRTGIVAFRANGTVTINTGTSITTAGKGYTGGPDYGVYADFGYSSYGESEKGKTVSRTNAITTNGTGGGSGQGADGSGGGGGYATTGGVGQIKIGGSNGGTGGAIRGAADLSTLQFGGGGGSSGVHSNGVRNAATGGISGGMILIAANTVSNSGTISANGNAGQNNTWNNTGGQEGGGGGGGAGGSVFIAGNTIGVGSGLVTASGGTGGSGYLNNSLGKPGGAGGDGRVRIESGSITGTTTPTASTSSQPSGNLNYAYNTSLQSWTSEIKDAGSENVIQPNKLTVMWAEDGSDNIHPKFQVIGSNTGSFSGEEIYYPAGSSSFYQQGGTYPITSGTELDTSAQINSKFRYWKVKVFMDTGSTITDTPLIYDVRLRDYHPSITFNQVNNVGIGTSTPSFRLDVRDVNDSTASAMIYNSSTSSTGSVLGLKIGATTPGTSNYFATFMDGNGSIIGKISGNGANGVTYSTSGVDFAEYFKKSNPDEMFETGDLVCFAADGGVTKCTSALNDILGVVSAHPAFAGGSNHDKDPNYVAVGLMGQLPVKVSNENGNIKKGDSLTYSTTEGVAQKVTSKGQIIGKALSDLACDTLSTQQASDSASLATGSANLRLNICKGTVFAYVHASYYDNGLGYSIGSMSASFNPQVLGAMTQSFDNIIVSDNATFNNVGVTGTISAGTLTIDGLNGTLDSLGTTLKLQSLATGNIEFEGGLASIDRQGNIKAQEITVKKLNIDNAETSSSSIGQGTIKTGQITTIISSTAVTSKSKIFVTATSDTSSPLIVVSKNSGTGFSVKVITPQTKDITFDWFIVN